MIRVGIERVKEVNAEKLHWEFSEMVFKPGELVEEFTLRLQAVAYQLRVLGDDVPNKSIIKRLLHAVPDHLEQVVISIETLMDLDIVSVEEVTSRLHAVEKRKKASSAPVKDTSGRLLLMEEWATRFKIRNGESSKGNSDGSGSENQRGGGRTRSRGHSGGGSRDLAQTGGAGPDDICNYCGEKGHFEKVCRTKKRNEKGQAHLTQETDDHDEALLMAHGVVLNPAPATHVAVDPAPTPPPQHVFEIEEQRVFAQLGPTEDREYKRWGLDTGATNHMIGAWGAFSELDFDICGTVRFDDGSIIEIEGCGTILFTCKSGEHRALTGVYYIPRLTTNILSLGQMDEAGCRVDINAGLLWIFDQRQQLLVKVR
jgi:hypothetical protein